MQSATMSTFSLRPRRCNTSCHIAAAASRPSLSWRRRRRHAALQCRQVSAGTQDEVNDPLSKNPYSFYPSVWGDFFLYHSNSATSSQQQIWITERVQELKNEVAKVITNSINCSLLERLHLIDALEHLCVDHLFEVEINVTLTQINNADVSDCDLDIVALWFYLLRKHGYKVSPDVFMKFKLEEGTFAANTPRELLSLYNAAHFRTQGERILDEATLFTKRCLESKLPYLQGSLAREIQFAFEIPLPRRVAIFGAKYYISTYEKEAAVNEMVLQLAKLNFNLMQLHHQQELKVITSWWKDLEIQSRLSFARDRVVECYFWMVGIYIEPSYSLGRIILTKVLAIVSLLDDVYDVYGTSKECELFTMCLESWDRKMDHYLPEYMKFVFWKILDTYQSIEDELALDKKYRMSYLKNYTINLVRAYNKEVKWRDQCYIPATVDEHLQVSTRTSACDLLCCTSFLGMGDIATKESFDWLCSVPKIVQALCVILRLSDDLKSYEREKLNPHVASTIESCMKEHNIPIEMAHEKIRELIEETWKDFNGEWLESTNTQSRQLLERIFNLTRTMEFMYKQDDVYTNCHVIKDTIHSLFVEPLVLI